MELLVSRDHRVLEGKEERKVTLVLLVRMDVTVKMVLQDPE